MTTPHVRRGRLSKKRLAYERFTYLVNPLRSGNNLPERLRNTGLWERLFRAADPLRHWYWRAKNIPYAQPAAEDDQSGRAIVDALRRDGIAVCPGFATEEQAEELLRSAKRYAKEAAGVDVDALAPQQQAHLNFMGADLDDDDPVMRFMRSPRLFAIARAHLGFTPRLRRVAFFVNQPQPDLSGHLNYEKHFHIDPHDFRVLKFFLYLNEVGTDDGPFTYVRGTHYFGRHRGIIPRLPAGAISTETMARFVRLDEWLEVTGGPRTGVFAETSGVHRGGRNRAGARLMLVAEYASRHPWVRYDHDIPKP
jgi:hypothetical protein